MKAWRKANPDRAKALLRKHQQAHALRKREEAAGRPRPAVCEACSAPSDRPLHWDHDHETGLFRGWLCQHCNLALGHARDSEWRLFALIAYLKKNEPTPVAA